MDGELLVSVDLVRSLSRQLDARLPHYGVLAEHYEGDQPLNFLPPEIREEVGRRLTSAVVNWPRVIVDAVEERLDVEGFRTTGEDADADLWALWQANDLDEWSQMCHLDALLYGQSFAIVWQDADGLRISVESASEVFVEAVPGQQTLRRALKRWLDEDGWHAALYLPDRVEVYRDDRPAPRVVGDSVRATVMAANWQLVDSVSHPLGVVPVVTFTNRPRLNRLWGTSELADVLPLAQQINKLATDMMVTSESHAMPRRFATGIQLSANPAQRERLREEVKQYWDMLTTGRTMVAGQGVTIGQLPASDLAGFVNAINMITGQIAAIAKLPPHYLGLTTDNPASADAIRSAEASLVKKALRKQRQFGGSWERVMRYARAWQLGVAEGNLPPEYDRIEAIWRSPETPTVAQSADAAVKLTQGDQPVITPESAQEFYLGWSPVQIERDRQRREQAVVSTALAPVRAQLAEADRLMREQDLSQPAAYAAVGLLQAAAMSRDGA